jgi:hypothetical protein
VGEDLERRDEVEDLPRLEEVLGPGRLPRARLLAGERLGEQDAAGGERAQEGREERAVEVAEDEHEVVLRLAEVDAGRLEVEDVGGERQPQPQGEGAQRPDSRGVAVDRAHE